jgi:hypothetical protein
MQCTTSLPGSWQALEARAQGAMRNSCVLCSEIGACTEMDACHSFEDFHGCQPFTLIELPLFGKPGIGMEFR